MKMSRGWRNRTKRMQWLRRLPTLTSRAACLFVFDMVTSTGCSAMSATSANTTGKVVALAGATSALVGVGILCGCACSDKSTSNCDTTTTPPPDLKSAQAEAAIGLMGIGGLVAVAGGFVWGISNDLKSSRQLHAVAKGGQPPTLPLQSLSVDSKAQQHQLRGSTARRISKTDCSGHRQYAGFCYDGSVSCYFETNEGNQFEAHSVDSAGMPVAPWSLTDWCAGGAVK
jgi:hypothetical protein